MHRAATHAQGLECRVILQYAFSCFLSGHWQRQGLGDFHTSGQSEPARENIERALVRSIAIGYLSIADIIREPKFRDYR